jgi:hypothetical protein
LNVDTLAQAGFGTVGAFGALSLPNLPFVARWNTGWMGVGLNILATAAMVTASQMIRMGDTRNRTKALAVGGAIATFIRMGGLVAPNWWPVTMTATPLRLPGMAGNTDVLADRIAEEAMARIGVGDYDTGMEQYAEIDAGTMADYDTGMELAQASPTLTY